MKTLAAIGKYYIALSAVALLLMTILMTVSAVVGIFLPSSHESIGLGIIAIPFLILLYGLTGVLGIITLLVLRKIKQNPSLIVVLLAVGLLEWVSQSYAPVFTEIGNLAGWITNGILHAQFSDLFDLRRTNYYFIVSLLPYLLFIFFALCIAVQSGRSKNAASGESTTDVAK